MADSILSMEHITKVFTERKVFDDTSFFLQEGEKVGVIGVNGTGKSTLLRMIAGLEEPDGGQIIRANNLYVKYLPQTPEFPKDASVIEAVLSGNETEENQWTLESDAKAILTCLGVYEFAKPVKELSGGQRKRLALVSALLAPADVLVLDEPTNHLDQEMSSWLEELLINSKKTIVLVTHDRYFLDHITDRMIEIDKGKIYSYQTNYSGYLELKMQKQEMALSSEAKRQNILRKELDWIRRGARARSTKQKGRIQRYEQLKAQEAPIEEQRLQLESIFTRMGKTTVELHDICKSYDSLKLIDQFSYIFLKADRVGFVGPNGAGKTTLMKILAGKEKMDSGELTIGQTIRIGYYSQEPEYEKQGGIAYMDPQTKVIDYIKDAAEYVRTNDGLVSASKMLERFLFTSSMQYTLIEKLSGGEKRRLYLLRVLMEAPNVLILDEPTNDLDIASLNILEDYLDAFEGIVIVVSHDRYFLDRTVRRIFAFEGNGRISQYEGGYSDYLQKRPQKAFEGENSLSSRKVEEQKPKIDSKTTWKNGPKKLKFTYQEQKDFDHIEEEIAELEAGIEELEKEIIKNARDFVKLRELTGKKEEKESKLEERMDRWMYLEDLAERIKNQ